MWGRLFATFPTNELLDLGLISASTRPRYPGLMTMYRPVDSIYDDPLLMLDISKPVRAFFRAGTISAGGVLFGTDKIIHFINVGRIYHSRYVDAVARGLSEPEASLHAVNSTADNPLLSEDGLLGLFTTGIHSNGDLASNYAGLKFYRKLTEAVRIGPTLLAPMLGATGPTGVWPSRTRRRPSASSSRRTGTRCSTRTPTWPTSASACAASSANAATTSSTGTATARAGRRAQSWFATRQRELARLFGEPYGHELATEHPVSVAEICWSPPPR